MLPYIEETGLTQSEAADLAEHEIVIERGIGAFEEVGNALLDIRDRRLYRAEYATFEAYCRDRWGFVASRARQLIAAASVVANLSDTNGNTLPMNERTARELSGLTPDEQREVWQAAVETAPDGKVTAAHVRDVAQAYKEPERPEWVNEDGEIEAAPEPVTAPTFQRLAPMMSSDSGEWYTPPEFIERVERVFGGQIDLDPASSAEANEVIGASRYFTREDDALSLDWWSPSLYANFPYGDVIDSFIDKLLLELNHGHVHRAIVLVPARTDTIWFRKLRAFPRCFIAGRLKFRQPGTEATNSAPFPSAVVALANSRVANVHPDLFYTQFAQVFSEVGDVYQLWDGA